MRRWNVAIAIVTAGVVAVGARAELPWYVGAMEPTVMPPAGRCSDPGVPALSLERFDVGCVDVATGAPVECLARFRTWFGLEEVPAGGRLLWMGWHDHDPARVSGPFADLVGDMWSMLDPKPPGARLEEFGGRTGGTLWPSFKMAPVVGGVVRILGEYTILDPNRHFVERWPWRVDPADRRFAWLQVGVNVGYGGLVELPSEESLYVRCGVTAACTGRDNVEPEHPAAFHGTPELIEKVRRLAKAFRQRWGAILTVTDMSLPWGGLFDVDETWTPPHTRHRNGRSVDISRRVWVDTPNGRVGRGMVPAEEDWLRDYATGKLGLFQVPERTIHFDLNPVVPKFVCNPGG